MKKPNFLIFTVVALLVINIGTLSFLFVNQHNHKKPHPRRHQSNPKNIIIERLQLDDNQQAEYKTLIEQHREGIENVERSIRKLKAELYQQLNQESSSQKDSIIHQLSSLHAKIESIHYQHFNGLKAICKPDQMEDFKELSKDLAKIFGRHRKRRPRH